MAASNSFSVLVLGHSFVRRLRDFSKNADHIRFFVKQDDLEVTRFPGPLKSLLLDPDFVDISFNGVGGSTLCVKKWGRGMGEECWYKFLPNHLPAIEDQRPDILYLHIGGNDLDSGCDPEFLAATIISVVQRLLRAGVKRVLVSQLLDRLDHGTRQADFSQRVDFVNEKLANWCLREPQVEFLRHKGLNNNWCLDAKDGTHPNSWGMIKYFRSVRGGIMRALKSLGYSE